MFSSILRKIPSLPLPFHIHIPISIKHPLIIPQPSPKTSSSLLMEDSTSSLRLAALAQQLRLYKPPSFVDDDDDNDDDIEEESGKVVAQVGFAESSNPIGQNLEEVRELEKEEKFMPKRAAVLVCLFEGDDGKLRVILTKRSSKLSTHSGEVALPGGKAEESDKDDKETATREAKEEIGLDPSLVNVVTTLEPFLSKHLLKVVPVIGILSDKDAFKPVPNVAEVETIFDALLEMFIKDDHHSSEEREWMGYKYLIHFFYHETHDKKYVIWGLTAAILIRAASVVYQKPPPFLEQNPKFKQFDWNMLLRLSCPVMLKILSKELLNFRSQPDYEP